MGNACLLCAVPAVLLAQSRSFVSAAASLPRSHVTSPAARTGEWHFQVGEQMYRSPEATSPLSNAVKDYYYAFAESSALTPELRERRVGGEGRLHIFHLPDKSSWPQKSFAHADRRAAISAFVQLEHGATVSPAFPEYQLEQSYKNPLSDVAKLAEKDAVARVTPEIYSRYLRTLTAEYTRSWSNKSATDDEISLLSNEFKTLGFETCTQRTRAHGTELVNVIAYAQGKKSDIAVVGAHYDSRPFDGPAPGAVDNGSGVAGLLSMARAFKGANIVPESSVYFVAFAGEEPGLWGSASFASELQGGGNGIPSACRPATELKEDTKIAAIIMDEIGWVSESLDKTTVNLESEPWTAELMNHLAGSCMDHNGDSLRVIHNSHPFGSDHMSFLDRSMQSVLTIQGDDEAYPHYHKSSDTIDHVTPEYASQIVKMNMGALLRMAGVQEKMTSPVRAGNLRKATASRHHWKMHTD